MNGTIITILTITVVFWNVENFFPERPGFKQKANSIAKTILAIADAQGNPPEIIALAEVENAKALKRLVYNTSLSKLDYRFVHYDSPDRRGIDCALLYRPRWNKPLRSSPKHLYDSTGNVLNTRDILIVEFDSLAILVNHHPSKVGRNGPRNRRIAISRMTALCDSLQKHGTKKILCVGDFNDNLWGPFKQGTIKYNGAWDKIDGFFQRGFDATPVSERVFNAPFLSCPDKTFGGVKPYRAYSGPRYTGGVSDHYPIVLTVPAE